MKQTNIVFLLGTSKAGKDTIGNYMVEKYNFERVSFADVLKEEFAKLKDIDVKILHEQGPEKEFYRPELIEYAEAKRAINPTCWLEKAFEKFLDNGNFKEDYNLVITDCRRDAEIDWVADQKNIIISVNERIADLQEQKFRNREFLEVVEMEAHYFRVYLVYVKNDIAEKNDLDMLTHYCIGYAKGKGVVDVTLLNNSTLDELKKKTDKLINCLQIAI